MNNTINLEDTTASVSVSNYISEFQWEPIVDSIDSTHFMIAVAIFLALVFMKQLMYILVYGTMFVLILLLIQHFM